MGDELQEMARGLYVRMFDDCDGWDGHGAYRMVGNVRYDHDDLLDSDNVAAALQRAYDAGVSAERERLKQEADLAGYAGLVAGLEWGKHK